ncbi:transcription factor IIIA-like [Contarinia nasturtii]|uniref:transcription factor IIIA-like n=1 Tax=Contarinia nasturtii TaxID=265458 RepID=UPI0012D397F9|nr:transcription factor IIIA-like [Contarinia nasturtii]
MSSNNSDGWSFLSTIKYTCKFPNCDLQFRRKDRLDAHEFTHSKMKKFQCNIDGCDKAYITNSHLQRHTKTVHFKLAQNVYCPHESCGKFFHSVNSMKAHCHQIHSEIFRAFECDICGEKFRRKTQLKQHMFVHTGNYRYTCDKCGKGFHLMSRLKRHENSHRTRQCPDCGATFDKWSLLLAHKNKEHINSDLKCSICNREFHSRRLLKIHRKTHANLDDRIVYECPYEGCSKVFLQNQNMLAHYKSKHENRTFPCTYDGCTLELSTKQKLNLHIKAMHLGEVVNKKPKKVQKKAERKDKGTQKISTASKFFKFILPPAFERAIIAGQGKNIHIEHGEIEDEDSDTSDREDDLETSKLTTVKLIEGVVKC